MNRRTVCITGASKGIGYAIAKKFADGKHNLVLNTRTDEATLRKLQGEINEAYPGTCVISVGDVGNPEYVAELIWVGEQTFGEIDILVNNAGVSYVGLLTDMSVDEWKRLMDTNLNSLFYTTRKVIPAMVQKQSGHIINISSIWGNVGASCEVAYSASKGAMNVFTKALAKELAPSHIQVNAVACGVIDTAMNACFSEEEKQALTEEIPMGRFGTPEEVAELVYFLAHSPEYLTGQIITLDGGLL